MEPIFTDLQIENHLGDRKLSEISNVKRIRFILNNLIEELNSGKLAGLKEESIKSRFLTTFFGEILGFNCGNSNNWFLYEEKKSKTDATKPDGCLGYFYVDKPKDIVKAVIEVKGLNIELDKKQQREPKNTPVEQGFSYAPKSGGKVKWVIITNIQEIRFYSAKDMSRYQVFYLKELTSEAKLKELLFLFHKDFFIKEKGESRTDQFLKLITSKSTHLPSNSHILDQIYNAINDFDGFKFIDPHYLCTIPPFNILREYVYHYEDRQLVTYNSAIADFISELSYSQTKIVISEKLKDELNTALVSDYEAKLSHIFDFLDSCFVDEIIAFKSYKKYKIQIGETFPHNRKDEDVVSLKIKVYKNPVCDCVNCNYTNLNIAHIVSKLNKERDDENNHTLEYAYGYHLISHNDGKTAYVRLRKLEELYKGNSFVKYFLTKYNLRLYSKLIGYYCESDKKEIEEYANSIDLDYVISEELEFNISNSVRTYLIKIKEKQYIRDIEERVNHRIQELKKAKGIFDNNGYWSGPNYIKEVYENFLFLCSHVRMNYLQDDSFYLYKRIIKKILEAFVISYQTPKIGITFIPFRLINEAILYLGHDEFQSGFNDLKSFKIEEDLSDYLIKIATNFLSSWYEEETFFNHISKRDAIQQVEYLSFNERMSNIFSNLMVTLTKAELPDEVLEKINDHLVKYLKVETQLHHYNLKSLSFYLSEKGYVLGAKNLDEILRLSIEGYQLYSTKYAKLIGTCAIYLNKFFPDYKINDLGLVIKAIGKCYPEHCDTPDLHEIYFLLRVLDEGTKNTLITHIEKQLDANFQHIHYETLIRNRLLDWTYKDYFRRYVAQIKELSNCHSAQETNSILFNFVLAIHDLKIDPTTEELDVFTDLSDFEKWIINPFNFDYSQFDSRWISHFIPNYGKVFLSRVKHIQPIAAALEDTLRDEYDESLARIYFTYFKST